MMTTEELIERLLNQALGAEGGPGHHWTSPVVLRDAADRLEQLEAEIKRLRFAIDGLLHRHKDGSDERLWEEWDCARAALNPKTGA